MLSMLILYCYSHMYFHTTSTSMQEELKNGDDLPFFLVGAHLPLDEDGSLLSASLNDWQRSSQVKITSIVLNDWNIELVNQFVSDVLQQGTETTLPLVRLVHEQTQGSVFHVLQFLRLLTEQELLVHNGEEWQWDLRELECPSWPELLLYKMRQLDRNVQISLKIAACMGAVDDSATALMLDDKTSVASSLQEAADAGLLVFSPQEGGYKFAYDRI
jgi:predicted ATPase